MTPQPAASPSSASRPERARYEVVGAAMREAIAAVIAEGKVDRRSRVFLAVLFLTASYSRITDRIYVDQIAAVARLEKRHTRRALAELAACGAIWREPGQGRGKASWVSLPSASDPKAHPLMNLVREHSGDEKRGPDSALLSDEKEGQIETEKGARSGPPTEKLNREENVVERAGAREAETGDDDASFVGLLTGLSPSSWQRHRWRAAHRESEAGFTWCVRQATDRGEKPEAYLDALIQKGEHRASANGGPPLPRPLADYTGCRECRGSHGLGHVRSPLGTDRPPPDWPHPKPTRKEIAAAFDELGSTLERKRTSAARPIDPCMACGERAPLIETEGRLLCETCAAAEEAA